MILIYLLLALTLSMVLLALFSAHIPDNRRGDVFIGFFAVFMALAWAVDEWLIPALMAGLKEPWLPVTMIVIFFAVLIVSTTLAITAPRPFREAVSGYKKRLGIEAAAINLIILFALLFAGINLMKAAGI